MEASNILKERTVEDMREDQRRGEEQRKGKERKGKERRAAMLWRLGMLGYVVEARLCYGC